MARDPEEDRPQPDEDEGGPVKSFLEHLEDFRWTLIKSASAVFVCVLICMLAGNRVVAILVRPLQKAQIQRSSDEKTAVFRYGTNRLGSYALDVDQWDALNAPLNTQSPWLLATNEIVNLKSLAGKLQDPGKKDDVSKYVAEHLSAGTRVLITNFNANQPGFLDLGFFSKSSSEEQKMQSLSNDLAKSLSADLNHLIEGGTIYDSNRFDRIKLSPGTAALVGQTLQGPDLFRWNRKLLLNAYPTELVSGGRRSVDVQLEPKSDGTNLMLVLSLDKNLGYPMSQNMDMNLIVLGPAHAFLVGFRVALYAGIAMASPFIFFFVGQFVLPALRIKEKKYLYRGLLFAVPLFVSGVLFCYFILMPAALAASQMYANWFGFSSTMWEAGEYIEFVSKFMLGMGLGFELPVVVLILVKIGIIDYRTLVKARPYMIVINLVLGAVLTTPEVFTQVLMAVPLQVLFEISVFIAWYWHRQEKKREAAAEAAENNR